MKTIVDLAEEQKEYFLEKDTAAKQAVEANIAPVEADPSSASRTYVVGEQLFLNDVLYDVTSPISVGDAIVVDTNITAANKLSADIKSKIDDLYSKNQTLTNQVSSLEEENGYYNLCPPLTNILTGTGISWQLKDDMSSVANGTATSMNQIATKMFTLEAGTYKINGLPSGGGTSSTFKMWLLDFSSGTETALVQMAGTSDYTFTVTANNKLVLRADVYKNYTASNLNFKPMIRKSDRTSNTYIPYRAKNLKLTQETTALLDNLEVNGAVNMLPNNATTQTLGDGHVTFTVNNDGTVTATADGQQTSNVELPLYTNSDGSPHLVGKTVKLSGCPSGGSTSTYSIQAYRVGAVDGSTGTSTDNGDGIEFTWLNNGSGTKAVVKIIIRPSYSGTVTFKPMLTVPSYNGDYVPYAKSNKELTDVIDNVKDYYFEVDETAYGYPITVNTDGVKSYKTLLNELATGLLAKAQALKSGEYIHVVSIQGYNGEWFLPLNTYYNFNNSATSVNMEVRGLNAYGNNAHIKSMSVHTTPSSCVYYDWTITTSGNTVADMTNDVPATGKSMTIMYTIRNRFFR